MDNQERRLENKFFDSNSILEPLKKPIDKKLFSSPTTNRVSNLGQTHISKDPIPKTPKTCPMSEDEIAKHSILESWKQKMPEIDKDCCEKGREYGVLRLATNILADGLITGDESNTKPKSKSFAKLDGIVSPKENFKLWKYLAEDIECDISKDISEGLNQLENYSSDCENLGEKSIKEEVFYELALKYSHQIQQLQKGQSLPLCGGWINEINEEGGGHVVIYEFTRIDEKHFDICIITSTIFQLADSAIVGNKQKIQPVVLFAKVPESQIFFSENRTKISPAFIQSLMQPRVLSAWDSNRKFTEEDILKPFDHLLDYQIELPVETYGLITGQRGGTCVASSTKQWIRKRTKHLGLYKQFLFRCKFKMLVATYQELQKKVSEDSETGQLSRTLLKYSAQNLLRTIAKLVDHGYGYKGLIDPIFALQAQATCYDLLQKIENAEQSIEEEKKKLFEGGDLQKMDPSIQRNSRVKMSQQFYWTSSGKPQTIENHYIPQHQEIQTAAEFYNKASHFLKQSNISISQRLSEMHEIIDSVPLPKPPFQDLKGLNWIKAIDDPFWGKCTIKELQSYLEVIENLNKAYPINDIELPGRRQATYLTFYTLTHYLSLLIENKMIDENLRKDDKKALLVYYKAPNYALMTTEEEWEGIVYADRNEHQRVVQSFNYFRSFNNQAINEALFTKGYKREVWHWDVKDDSTAGCLWKALIEGDSTLKKEAQKIADEKFPDLGKDEIEKDFEEQKKRYEIELKKWMSKPYRVLPTPKKKVNLPESSKLTLILEGSISQFSNNNALSKGKNNYNHINHLRRMNYTTFCVLKENAKKELVVDIERESQFSYECFVRRSEFPEKKSEFGTHALNKCLLPMGETKTKTFKNEPKFHRSSGNWEASFAEGNTLIQNNNSVSVKEIIRTLPEWKLAPIQIINELDGNFDLLQDPSDQALFLNLLFRSPVLYIDHQVCDIRLGLGELIVDDQALEKRLSEFINKGLAHFKRKIDTGVENDRSCFNGTRFFFSLAFLLANYAKDAENEGLAKRFNYIQQINDWLQQSEKGEIFLSTEEKAVLHKNRMLFYSTTPRKSLEMKDFTAIYQSWILSQMVSHSGKWKNCTEDVIAKNFALDLYAKDVFLKIKNRSLNKTTLCDGILQGLKLDEGKNKIQWSMKKDKDNIIRGEKKSNSFWEIDFVRGIIYNENGKIGCGPSNHPWRHQSDFARLFGGNTRFEYRSLGDKNYTFDSQFGPIRLIKNSNNTYAIQRQYDGRLYELMDRKIDILENQDLGILGKDHVLWVPKDEKSDSPGKIPTDRDGSIISYLSDLEKGQRKFALMENGSVIEVNPDSGLPEKDSCIIDHLDSVDNYRSLLSQFDFKTSILVHRNKESQKIEKISFPRYTSTEGAPLELDFKRERFVWAENNNYALAKKRPKSLLGSIEEDIYLESTNPNEKNKGKLLVPLQVLKAEEISISDAKIDIANQSPLLPSTKDQKKEQWGCHEYLVFDVNNGVVSASSSEEKLFLAYIYHSQKRFDDAVNLLRQLRPTEHIFERGMKILDMIQAHPIGEDHPDAKMVILQALFIQMKRTQDMSKVKIEKFIPNVNHLWKILQMLTVCSQRLNDISVDCKFSSEDELWLYRTLLNEAVNRKDEILEKLSAPEKPRLQNVLDQISHRKTILQNSKQIEKSTPKASKGERNTARDTLIRFFEIDRQVKIKLPKKPFDYRSSSESEESYKNRMIRKNLKYENDIENNFGWIRSGDKGTLLNACPPKDFKNGSLLLEILKIAQEGSLWEHREAMFRLKQWNTNKRSCRNGDYLKLMIHILYCPPKKRLSLNQKIATTKDIAQLFESLANTSFSRPQDLSDINKFICNGGSNQQKHVGGDYPLTYESIFDTIPTSKKISKKIPISVENDTNRWDVLTGWRNLYHNNNIEEKKESKDFSFKFDGNSMLSKEEKDFRDPLVNALKAISEDYKEGKKQNEAEKTPSISQKTAKEILNEAKERRTSDIEKKIATLTNNLEHKARSRGSDEREIQSKMALIGGKVKKDPTFDDCVRCLLTQDVRDYELMNDKLDEKEMEEIAELTLKIEDLKSERAQLLRIEEWSEKIIHIEDENDLNRQYACIKLDHELQAKYHFSRFLPEEQIIFRIFSGQTGKIPYEKQMKVIEEMLKVHANDPVRFKNIVAQLIMGGGKTDVIAALVIYLSILRNKDRLGIFIVPSALFDSVKNNFGENMKKAFGAVVDTIDIEREHLKDDDKLVQILEKLKLAKRDRKPLIAKASSIQCFELELFSVARTLKKTAETMEKEQRKLTDAIERKKNLEKALLNLDGNQAEYHHTQTALQFQEKVLIPTLKNTTRSLKGAVQKLEVTSKLLAKIVDEFAQRGDPLGDEVDMMLDCRQEVNFPEGDSSSISPMANELLCEVYKILISDTKVEDLEGEPTIASLTRIRTNEQSLLNTTVYQTKIVPLVAKLLAENYAPLREELNTHKESFIRYASGTMRPELQKLAKDKYFVCTEKNLSEKFPGWNNLLSLDEAEKDIAFLRETASRHASEKENRRRFSDLAALTKHILTELTPATLTKSGRRDYGPKPGSDQLEVIPYVAVNAPAKTEFGYYLELACYYLQWILANPMEEKDLQHIGKVAKEAANYYVIKNGEKLNETVEYIEFEKMFGITFDELNEPEKVKKAIEEISKNPSKQLLFAYETIAQNVFQRDERYTSNWAALCDLFASFRTMGGTPWNYEGFKAELATRFMGDLGTEGKIIETMAKKAAQMRIHETEVDDLESLFASIYSDPKNLKETRSDANKVRGIIEGGGYFKKFKNNREVAEKMATILKKMQKEKKIDGSIEYVVYYDADPGQHMADTLYALNIHTKTRVRIGGTSLEALNAKGLNPSNYFSYYDERHTTGADIPQLPDALFVGTFDEKKMIRSWLQETMRLRQFLMFQGLEIAVSPRARNQIINKGATINDFIISALKNQTIRKTKDMIRFFRQQIDNIFRKQASLAIRKAALGENDLGKVFAEYERFVLTTTEHDPFLLFGSLKAQVNTKEMLISYLQKKLEIFKNNVSIKSNQEAIEMASQEAKDLENYIREKVTCLPENWEDSSSQIGTENEVELQAHVEVQQKIQVDQEIESDVELELKAYEQIQTNKVRKDNGMSLEKLEKIVNALKSESPIHEDLISLQKQLQDYPYHLLDEKVPYHQAFKKPIYGTTNYFYTFEDKNPLPVFHKSQRPPKQILAVQGEDGLRYLLLSEREAADVHDILKKMYSNEGQRYPGVWLLDSKFNQLCDGPHCDVPPKPNQEDEAITSAMIEINAFGGFADNLDANGDDFEKWFLDGDSKLKLRFLKLKTARNEKQNQILRRIPCVVGSEDESATSLTHHVFKARAEQERLRQGNYIPNSLEEAKTISPHKIQQLNVQWIDKIHLDWDKGKTCVATKLALQKFNIQSKLEAEKHNIKIYANLKPFQIPYVPASNVDWLPNERIRNLTTPEQLKKIGKRHVQYLDPKQAPLVPFIDKELYQFFEDQSLIQAIPPKDIEKANPDYLSHFKKAQVQNMPKDWIKNINTQIQFSWIHGNLLKEIPEEYREHVTKEQIGMISEPSLIKNLESLRPKKIDEGTWTSWIAPEMVQHIDFDTQLKYLKARNLIEQVPNDHVQKLNLQSQVPLIKESQVPDLSNEQIPYCPNNLVFCIPPEKVGSTTDKQIPFLRGRDQVQKIVEPERFAHLKAQTDIEKGLVNQMQWISDEQLQLVSKDQIIGLLPQQIKQLANSVGEEKWQNLRESLSKEQIPQFDSADLIQLLSDDQIKANLITTQVHLLEITRTIQACPDHLVKMLDQKTQVPHVLTRQIPFLEGVYQVQSLTESNKFQHLIPEQMKWISDHQLAMVLEGQVPGLSTEQIVKLSERRTKEWEALRKGLTKEQIQSFNTKAQIELLADDQIREYLTEAQVQFLQIRRTIRACRNKLVKNLDPKTQVPLISPAQVPHLEGENQVLACPKKKNYVENLLEVQLPHLFVDRKNPQEIVKEFPKLTIGRITNAEHLSNINYKQWKYLPENEKLIQEIPYKDIQYLTREQLRKRSWRQFLVYTVGVITLGIVGSVVALLAHISLITLIIHLKNKNTSRIFVRKLHSHPRRLYRYFMPVS